MDVHLVLVEDRFGDRSAPGQPAQARQLSLPAFGIPGARHVRFRSAKPSSDGAQRPAHGAEGDLGKAPLRQFQGQQLARPGRPLPAELGRNAQQDTPQFCQEPFVDLRLPVVDTSVEQTLLAKRLEALGHADHGRRGTVQVAGGPMLGKSLVELQDHEVAEGGSMVLGLLEKSFQPTSHRAIESEYGVHGRVSIVRVGLATATIDGMTFPFNFLPANPVTSRDHDSRTVV
jgi:hypothetical protein